MIAYEAYEAISSQLSAVSEAEPFIAVLIA